jgi:hypothetical protein
MLWNLDVKLLDVYRAEQLKAKVTKKASNSLQLLQREKQRKRSISPQQRTIPKHTETRASFILCSSGRQRCMRRARHQPRMNFLSNPPSASIDLLLLCSQDVPSHGAISTAMPDSLQQEVDPKLLVSSRCNVLLDIVTIQSTCILEEG